MFDHPSQDMPVGTLSAAGYRLYLAELRFIVALDKALRLRATTRWLSNRLG